MKTIAFYIALQIGMVATPLQQKPTKKCTVDKIDYLIALMDSINGTQDTSTVILDTIPKK